MAAVGNTWTYLGNQPCATACAWPNWDHKTYTVEDLAVAHIRLADGAVVHVETSFATHIEKDAWTFQIFGEKGGATMDPLTVFYDQAGVMINATPTFLPKVDVFEAKMRNFVDTCLYDKPSMAPGAHGVMVQKMLNGLYASAEAGGKEVAIS